MAVTVPDWADTLLDLVGVNWPNVDEDAYREMADALREFADDLADDGQLANNHMERLLSSGHGEAMDALNEHWGKVKGKHLKDMISAARTIAGALDMAAGAIEGMKWKAVAELGILAGQTGLALALIPVTGGLSALLGAGAIAFTKKQLLKLITGAMEEAVGHIVAVMTEPAVAALENMAADLVVQLGANAMGIQNGVDLDQTKQAGKDGLNLARLHGRRRRWRSPRRQGLPHRARRARQRRHEAERRQRQHPRQDRRQTDQGEDGSGPQQGPRRHRQRPGPGHREGHGRPDEVRQDHGRPRRQDAAESRQADIRRPQEQRRRHPRPPRPTA
ncbi:hypothetical protein ACF05T_02570 [Streptomyces lateritius]|uniref:Outer membrane channel protein CpnT-like N-terminal domain-containing protein n=1 Tax=Streptomyces lateritius TaxID=67313 RepID=A0ABW6Y5B4_9ACTN